MTDILLQIDGRDVWVAPDDPRAPKPVAAEPAALPDITDRQCFQQAAVQGLVSEEEALSAVTVGLLPKAVTDGIAALPADQRFEARMLLCGETTFRRDHPMVPVFFAILGITAAADIDTFWRAASLL